MSELLLIVGGKKFSGWESIRVTRSIERFPSDFELVMTERFAGELKSLLVVPGDTCEIMLGDDLVLTGFVEGYQTSLSSGQHDVRLYGRNKCCDLVDASAEWPGGQIVASTALGIAKKLAFNFGLDVEGIPENSNPIPAYSLQYGESSYTIIERVCRFRGLLAYDTPEGRLRLARAATIRSSSGLAEGGNVQSCSIDYRIDHRFSKYVVQTLSMDVFADAGLYNVPDAVASDPGVNRHRILYIINEASDTNLDQAQVRADWEYRRRAGRSAQLHVVVDSWRDSNGMLWEPNTLVNLNLPSMKLIDKSWLLVDVTYQMDLQNGTTCQLRLMPAEAFEVQPPSLPGFLDVRRAMSGTPLGADAQSPEAKR